MERSLGGAKFLALIVDDFTDYCWKRNKSDRKHKVQTLLTDLNVAGVTVKHIRCDGADENIALNNHLHFKMYGAKFEFSGPRTPQRNGKVKQKIQTLYGRI
jgi:hypothetical protein